MSIKSVLCVFGGQPHEQDALNSAMALAQSHSAHIRVLHISPHPSAYMAAYGGEISAAGAIMIAIEKKNSERLAAAKQYAASCAQRHNIPLDAAEMPAHHASAQFLHLTGIADMIVAAEGRLSDLIIIIQPGDKHNFYQNDILTSALFNTGRPVLMIPGTKSDQPRQWRDKTAALAWDGSLEAARAMWGAMPLLAMAENFHVLTARRHGEAPDLAGEIKLMDYLKSHGLQTEIIAVDHARHNPAKMVLEQARELKTDLLVMGAYGHSRLREMFLGGFTEYMLKNTDIPLLLSH